MAKKHYEMRGNKPEKLENYKKDFPSEVFENEQHLEPAGYIRFCTFEKANGEYIILHDGAISSDFEYLLGECLANDDVMFNLLTRSMLFAKAMKSGMPEPMLNMMRALGELKHKLESELESEENNSDPIEDALRQQMAGQGCNCPKCRNERKKAKSEKREPINPHDN